MKTKFRKRPVVVEAEQWFPGKDVEGVFMEKSVAHIGGRGHGAQTFPQIPRAAVRTIHGQVAYLESGDWVITEPDGIHHYPCKPEIFNNTYEPVESDDGG